MHSDVSPPAPAARSSCQCGGMHARRRRAAHWLQQPRAPHAPALTKRSAGSRCASWATQLAPNTPSVWLSPRQMTVRCGASAMAAPPAAAGAASLAPAAASGRLLTAGPSSGLDGAIRRAEARGSRCIYLPGVKAVVLCARTAMVAAGQALVAGWALEGEAGVLELPPSSEQSCIGRLAFKRGGTARQLRLSLPLVAACLACLQCPA